MVGTRNRNSETRLAVLALIGYMGSDTARLPTDVLSKTHAKPFHLVLDPGNSSKNCSDWQRDPRLIASVRFEDMLSFVHSHF